jgi:hypothetical protein
MKKIFNTIILGTILLVPFNAPADAALTFCLPPPVPTTSVRMQEYTDCMEQLQESKEEQEKSEKEELSSERILFMCSVGTGPCPTTKPVDVIEPEQANATSTTEEPDLSVDGLRIKELKDQIVQLQIQLLTLKVELLMQQLKR